MAGVNTRNKRASAIGFMVAARLVLPAPDAAIVQADRQQVAYSYSGIAAVQINLIPTTAFARIVVRARARSVVVPARGRVVR